jgi:hypothetical protein
VAGRRRYPCTLAVYWSPETAGPLPRIIHEGSTAAADMGMLSGVLGPRSLRRSVQLRLGLSALRVPDITPICAASLQTLMNYAGYRTDYAPRITPIPANDLTCAMD